MGLFDKVSAETVQAHAKRMWETKLRDKYPFHAESPVSMLAPTGLGMEYGAFGSVVMKPNVRTWGFQRKTARDMFVHRFNAATVIDE